MKKTILLSMLFWLAFSAANITAQVRISGASDPASSAILDLNPGEEAVATGGLLLPRVYLTSLTDNAIFGDNIPVAQGIMVYNLNDDNNENRPEEGVYCYDGKKWLFVGTSTDCQPSPVTSIQFTGIREDGTVQLNDVFEATALPESDDDAIYYRWVVPGAYFDVVGQGKRTIRLKSKGFTAKFTDEIKVRAENRCGVSEECVNTTPFYTLDCEGTPMMPTKVVFSKTLLAIGDTLTATAMGALTAKEYVWMVSSGHFDIIGPRTGQTIILKAKMATTTMITTEIRVRSVNDCGRSDEYINSTPIHILRCLRPPLTPVAVTFDKGKVALYETLTLIADISPETPIVDKYSWEFPHEYFDVVGVSTEREIQLKAKMATLLGSKHEIRVSTANDCGKSDDFTVSIDVSILDCGGKPSDPAKIEFSKTTIEFEDEFTATVIPPSISIPNTDAVGYTWTIPENFEVVSGNPAYSQTLTLRSLKPGLVSDVKVVAYNACGTSAECTGPVLSVRCPVVPEFGTSRNCVKSSPSTKHYWETVTLTAPFHEGMTYDWQIVHQHLKLKSVNGNIAVVEVVNPVWTYGRTFKIYEGCDEVYVYVRDVCGKEFYYKMKDSFEMAGFIENANPGDK